MLKLVMQESSGFWHGPAKALGVRTRERNRVQANSKRDFIGTPKRVRTLQPASESVAHRSRFTDRTSPLRGQQVGRRLLKRISPLSTCQWLWKIFRWNNE